MKKPNSKQQLKSMNQSMMKFRLTHRSGVLRAKMSYLMLQTSPFASAVLQILGF